MPRTFLPISPKQRGFARQLRNAQTDCERKLWYHLRNRQLGDLKFRRQYAAPPYVLDFYCAEYCLAIELDGRQHLTDEGQAYDKARSRYLEAQGIRVVRFSNLQIMQQMDEVLEEILRCVQA